MDYGDTLLNPQFLDMLRTPAAREALSALAVMDEDHLVAAARYVALNPAPRAARRPHARLALVERKRAS